MGDGKAGTARRGPALPDLAYLVRPGDDNDELRYSLRSVAENMIGYRKVWICGTVPSWLTGVAELPLEPVEEKFANMRQSLTALCARKDAARTVVVMCDDIYITGHVDARDLPVFHLGPAASYARHVVKIGSCGEKNTWLVAMRETSAWVAEQGVPDPLAYEAHTPLPFDKGKLGKLLADYPAGRPFNAAEAYPIAGAGGVGVDAGNAKVATLDSRDFLAKVAQPMPYLSSNDASFADGMVGGYLRGMFRDPSPWEADA